MVFVDRRIGRLARITAGVAGRMTRKCRFIVKDARIQE
jgi:hypothetical protein